MIADDSENPDMTSHVSKINDMDKSKKGYLLSDVQQTLRKKVEIHGKFWKFIDIDIYELVSFFLCHHTFNVFTYQM